MTSGCGLWRRLKTSTPTSQRHTWCLKRKTLTQPSSRWESCFEITCPGPLSIISDQNTQQWLARSAAQNLEVEQGGVELMPKDGGAEQGDVHGSLDWSLALRMVAAATRLSLAEQEVQCHLRSKGSWRRGCEEKFGRSPAVDVAAAPSNAVAARGDVLQRNPVTSPTRHRLQAHSLGT